MAILGSIVAKKWKLLYSPYFTHKKLYSKPHEQRANRPQNKYRALCQKQLP